MCGIAGVLAGPQARRLPDTGEMRRMVSMLRHRGPDGWGFYRDGRIALAHARLAIVGLSDGHQPLTNEDRRIWITGNGEVFNHVELRHDLTARGHRFRTGSDTEVIIHAYEEWGEDAWRRLNGQFAFALWDGPQRRLYLVRDRLGILPLVWARTPDAVVFGSEAKALFAGGRVPRAFDPAGLVQVFTRWGVGAPDTVFEGVKSLRPGAALVFEADLSAREQIYWRADIQPSEAWRDCSVPDAAEALGAALSKAVDLRLRADVPVGCYVSGGLDSSLITALATAQRGEALDSYAVRFTDAAFDETPEQRLMAEFCGTRHHEILCDGSAIADSLADVVWHCETPLMRTAPVPLFLLSGLVRSSGQKVVLTGEGADELLAGYNIFKEDQVRRFWARQPDSAQRPRLLDRLYAYVGHGSRDAASWRRFFKQNLGAVDHPFYSHLLRWSNTAWSLRFLAPGIRASLGPERMMEDLSAALPPGWRTWEPLARAQAIEMNTLLSGHLLPCQGDRVAMANGIEVRYPFLDPDVVDLCGALPGRVKLLGLRDKLALRRMAAPLLPPSIAERPKKPYRAPAAPPLFSAAAPPWVSDVLTPDALARHGLVDVEAARLLIDKARARGGVMGGEREEMALVGLVTLQSLADQFLDGFDAHLAAAQAALDRTPPSVAVEPADTKGDLV